MRKPIFVLGVFGALIATPAQASIYTPPSLPGTGGEYIAAYTGAGGSIAIYGEDTPTYTTEVRGTLVVNQTDLADQYGDVTVAYFYGFNYEATWSVPNFFYYGCNYFEGDQCASLGDAPPSITVNFDLPPNSFISYVNGDITSIAAIPEPSSWIMLILGFTAIGFAARHKRHIRSALVFARGDT